MTDSLSEVYINPVLQALQERKNVLQKDCNEARNKWDDVSARLQEAIRSIDIIEAILAKDRLKAPLPAPLSEQDRLSSRQ